MSRRANDDALKARLAAQQQEQDRRARTARNARLAVTTALALVAAAAIGLSLGQRDDQQVPAVAVPLQSGPPPWGVQTAGLAERLADLDFPPGGDESYHAHVLLSVYRDGEQVPVPAGIGFAADGAHSSLHTHTPDGVIHMEADDPYPYQLDHVFRVWGVAFGPDRLGGDVTSGDDQVQVYVNGRPAASDVQLEDGDNIVVAYGTDGSFPTEPADDALDGA